MTLMTQDIVDKLIIDELIDEVNQQFKTIERKPAESHIHELEQEIRELDEAEKQGTENKHMLAIQKRSCEELIEGWRKIQAEEQIYNDPYDHTDNFLWDINEEMFKLNYVEEKHPELSGKIQAARQAFYDLRKSFSELSGNKVQSE